MLMMFMCGESTRKRQMPSLVRKLGSYKIPDHIKVYNKSKGYFVVHDAETNQPIAEIARDGKGWATVTYGGTNPPDTMSPYVEMQMRTRYGLADKKAWMQVKMYFDKGVSLARHDDTLKGFYYRGLVEFCYMISRNIPPNFRKKNTQKNEMNSSKHGIIAFKRCIKILKGEVEYVRLEPELQKFKHLHEWYLDSVIDFIQTTLGEDEIEGFEGQDHKQAAIYALGKAIKTLEKELGDLK